MATAAGRVRAGRGWSFYAGMSLVVLAVIAAGFGPTYVRSRGELPFWVHLHGLVMAAWILLFAVKAALIRARNWRLHRALGFGSIALVVLMVPLGIATNFLAIRRGSMPPFFTPAEMMAADCVDVLVFAGLFAAAVVLRRRGDWHKRLLLTATVLLTLPAIGRLVFGVFGVGVEQVMPASLALLFSLALAGPVFDWIERRRVHPAYLWGVGALLAAQPLHWAVANSVTAQGLVERLEAAGKDAA